jgi:hypothetical protein
VKVINPPIKTALLGFEHILLNSNLSADKYLSMLFPVSLDSKNYGSYLVPQVGCTYKDLDLAR